MRSKDIAMDIGLSFVLITGVVSCVRGPKKGEALKADVNIGQVKAGDVGIMEDCKPITEGSEGQCGTACTINVGGTQIKLPLQDIESDFSRLSSGASTATPQR